MAVDLSPWTVDAIIGDMVEQDRDWAAEDGPAASTKSGDCRDHDREPRHLVAARFRFAAGKAGISSARAGRGGGAPSKAGHAEKTTLLQDNKPFMGGEVPEVLGVQG